MSNSESSHAKYHTPQSVWQTMNLGSIMQLLEWQPLQLSTKLSSAVLIWCCVIRYFNMCCWLHDSTDSGYAMRHIEPDESHSKRKPDMTESNAFDKPVAVQHREGSHCRTAKILAGELIRLSLATMIFSFLIRFRGQAHVCTFHPSWK